MPETKHEKFLRLMQKRLERTLEEFRMISQLASSNYRNTPEEAREAIFHLDRGLKAVAQAYGVPYKTWIGEPTKTNQVAPQMGPINEIDVAKALTHLQAANIDEAVQVLKTALTNSPR